MYKKKGLSHCTRFGTCYDFLTKQVANQKVRILHVAQISLLIYFITYKFIMKTLAEFLIH